jgi:hypothetical protein
LFTKESWLLPSLAMLDAVLAGVSMSLGMLAGFRIAWGRIPWGPTSPEAAVKK